MFLFGKTREKNIKNPLLFEEAEKGRIKFKDFLTQPYMSLYQEDSLLAKTRLEDDDIMGDDTDESMADEEESLEDDSEEEEEESV